jgi:hypothetical protein
VRIGISYNVSSNNNRNFEKRVVYYAMPRCATPYIKPESASDRRRITSNRSPAMIYDSRIGLDEVYL